MAKKDLGLEFFRSKVVGYWGNSYTKSDDVGRRDCEEERLGICLFIHDPING